MNMLVPHGIEFCPSPLSCDHRQFAENRFHDDPAAFRDCIEAIGGNVCAFAIDHSGCIRYLSPSAEHVLDVTPTDVLGLPWEEMVAWRSEAVLAGLEAERRIVESKTPFRLVHRFFTHDGEHRAVRVWAAPVLVDGTVIGIGGYFERIEYRIAPRDMQDELN